jgi:2,3-bisphosphoglycerate-independent phosphoglycerate mutase
MKILFIFMDGVGLGGNDPEVNPFVRARLLNLDGLLNGNKIIADGHHTGSRNGRGEFHTKRASLLSLNACLGIEGAPQSASGQASLLTGKNVSAMLGTHDGPKPNPHVMDILIKGTLFSQLHQHEREVSLLNAYPPRYFKSIESGHRLPGVIALSAVYAGMQLKTMNDLSRGEAISVDFTAQGWREHLGLHDTPLLDPLQAGKRLMKLSNGCELSFFEYWLSDVAGHQQDMRSACDLLELFDTVLGSVIDKWDDDEGLILITSDHGNLEDLSTRHHTRNDVPLILIGSETHRESFVKKLNQARGSRKHLDLTDVTPAILSQD